jgi:segregation and condensation protein A
VSECTLTIEVVARFLGLLELYRDGVVNFDQAEALAELRVRWTGGPRDPDEPAGAPSGYDAAGTGPDPDEEYG